jgi:hypothetical protein
MDVMVGGMDLNFKYRGKIAGVEDVEFIKKLIDENPSDSRRVLSAKLCEAWNWRQANGALKDMVCRGFMLELHRAGYIRLPEKKCSPNNPFVYRKKPAQIDIDQSLVCSSLKKLVPLKFCQVRRHESEDLFNGLMEQHHYLGYCQPVGEHLKYIVFASQRPVACLAWSSAPRHIGCRDQFIGWSKPIREKNLHLMAYNSRFLILPWYKVSYLASHILGRMVKIVADDWQKFYGHKIFFLETFVDTERFFGTCYRAANWIYIGNTTGLGKNACSKKVNRSIKAVWGYPLSKDFRRQLTGTGL